MPAPARHRPVPDGGQPRYRADPPQQRFNPAIVVEATGAGYQDGDAAGSPIGTGWRRPLALKVFSKPDLHIQRGTRGGIGREHTIFARWNGTLPGRVRSEWLQKDQERRERLRPQPFSAHAHTVAEMVRTKALGICFWGAKKIK
ncbi:MAG: hypothetical protein O6840_07630 [Nitrospirae bacterium]|nr:hypothetical protein [Nitrospirota bacterium]